MLNFLAAVEKARQLKAEHAVVAGAVIDQRIHQFGGHELGVAGLASAAEQLGARRAAVSSVNRVWIRPQDKIARAAVQESPSPERTTVNSGGVEVALERIRSSPRTSAASPDQDTGLIREEATWVFQRSRSALNPPQRLDGVSFTAKISPSSR